MTEIMIRPTATSGAPSHSPDVENDPEVWVADFRAKVRAAGQEWSGSQPDELVELLTRAAAGDPRMAAVMRAGGRLLKDFLDGYQQKSAVEPEDLAGDLVDGRPLAAEVLDGLAARYLVVVIRPAGPGSEVDALHAAAGQGALMTHRDDNLVLLAPVEGSGSAERCVRRLTQCLGGRGWLATAEREKTLVAEGFDEASCVLRLVLAGMRPRGGYSISDVLVEYAVTLHERVRSDLAAMIRPLRAHGVLWETLVAFIDADYSRNKTARNLFVHRTTVDYRLRRVAAITGCDPTSGRGAQMLTAAMIAEAVER